MVTKDGEKSRARVRRALVVQSHGPDGVDALDYLAHTARADPFEVEADR